jgi:gamma-glutamylcyclotransferase (GGCT)/AIG2-like uncharacterized protein YtfP
MEHLFVYGTLMSNFSNQKSVFLHDHKIYSKPSFVFGELYDLGDYPGAITTNSGNSRIFGEIVRLASPGKILDVLDAYEGIQYSGKNNDGEYNRKKCIAWLNETESIHCWIYVYKGAVNPGMRIKSGNYIEYLINKNKEIE